MTIKTSYEVIKSGLLFADETAFKHKMMKFMENKKDSIKTVLAIENTVEPGMPDLIVVDNKNRSSFIEVKYARKGVITFKRTQIPWYRRHQNLTILILAYNDVTRNIHLIDANCIIRLSDGVSFRLADETEYEIKESL